MLIPVFIPMLIAMFVPMFFMAGITVIPMLFLITRNILVVVPVIPNEEYSPSASVVFVAVLFPMPDIFGRNAKIKRWAIHSIIFNKYRLGVDDLRLWKVADIQLTVKSGLPYADRDANVSGKCRCG